MDPEKGWLDEEKMSRPWIEKKKGWINRKERRTSNVEHPMSNEKTSRQVQDRPKKVYSVAEVARLLNVDKRTVMKWLDYDEDNPQGAVIPPNAWFKLPNGYIRIEEWIVLKLMEG